MTVRETLQFAAACQNQQYPADVDAEHAAEHAAVVEGKVDAILKILGLEGCAVQL